MCVAGDGNGGLAALDEVLSVAAAVLAVHAMAPNVATKLGGVLANQRHSRHGGTGAHMAAAQDHCGACVCCRDLQCGQQMYSTKDILS
eukprot:SAG11_NODE_1752_length_4316_cov_4.210576_2_plen_88_part_00